MRLEEFTPALLARVLEIYDRFAYPNRERRSPHAELSPQATPKELLELFTPVETKEGEETTRGFVRRLGNEHYPFMKLLFQEHLFPGQYCFAVDTHDDQEITSDFPDYEAWIRLKKTNREIKREIEAAWDAAGIPTPRLLREIARHRVRGADPASAGLILVADDEEEVAEAVALVLRARGYQVRVVFDGRQALEEVRREPPQLLILDHEMPHFSGVEVIDLLRGEYGLTRLPILLVTGGPITLTERDKASGFLCKPFSENLLLSVVRHLLQEDPPCPPPLQPPGGKP